MERKKKLEELQNEAIDEWIKNGYKGIVNLATGLGNIMI